MLFVADFGFLSASKTLSPIILAPRLPYKLGGGGEGGENNFRRARKIIFLILFSRHLAHSPFSELNWTSCRSLHHLVTPTLNVPFLVENDHRDRENDTKAPGENHENSSSSCWNCKTRRELMKFDSKISWRTNKISTNFNEISKPPSPTSAPPLLPYLSFFCEILSNEN